MQNGWTIVRGWVRITQELFSKATKSETIRCERWLTNETDMTATAMSGGVTRAVCIQICR